MPTYNTATGRRKVNHLGVLGTCSKEHKRQFANPEAATKEANSMSLASGWQIEVYQCRHCPWWHIGKFRCFDCGQNVRLVNMPHRCARPVVTPPAAPAVHRRIARIYTIPDRPALPAPVPQVAAVVVTPLPKTAPPLPELTPQILPADLAATEAEIARAATRLQEIKDTISALKRGTVRLPRGMTEGPYRADLLVLEARQTRTLKLLRAHAHDQRQTKDVLRRKTELSAWVAERTDPADTDAHALLLRMADALIVRSEDKLNATEKRLVHLAYHFPQDQAYRAAHARTARPAGRRWTGLRVILYKLGVLDG